jgi:hypothetical protein
MLPYRMATKINRIFARTAAASTSSVCPATCATFSVPSPAAIGIKATYTSAFPMFGIFGCGSSKNNAISGGIKVWPVRQAN